KNYREGGLFILLFESLNLEPEKEERIVNAATKVFAENGYLNASTNEIVKEAKISKGLLFHYFKSKKHLYLALFEKLSDMFTERIYERIDWKEKDILQMIRQVTLIKFEFLTVYPEMINFLNRAYGEDSPEVVDDIKDKREKLTEDVFSKLFTNIDLTNYKENIDPNKANEVIFWTFEGFANRQQEKVKTISVDEIDLENILEEIDGYIELLKNAFYK
ncbi:TetR/AcrR family transcriptional regulator, partial [Virgibacillus sp. DJP39]|uniref:TetR/AcrR family transcriptional regulator n=1 Tax=Virgibacillus sp. DJP39 TaxID=3409790 RepID=UPI003BB4A3D8